MTATEASRNFSDLLDAIERGETVTITRGHHAVAEMSRPGAVPAQTCGPPLSASRRPMIVSPRISRPLWR